MFKNFRYDSLKFRIFIWLVNLPLKIPMKPAVTPGNINAYKTLKIWHRHQRRVFSIFDVFYPKIHRKDSWHLGGGVIFLKLSLGRRNIHPWHPMACILIVQITKIGDNLNEKCWNFLDDLFETKGFTCFKLKRLIFGVNQYCN